MSSKNPGQMFNSFFFVTNLRTELVLIANYNDSKLGISFPLLFQYYYEPNLFYSIFCNYRHMLNVKYFCTLNSYKFLLNNKSFKDNV